jgi:hypothetical protein
MGDMPLQDSFMRAATMHNLFLEIQKKHSETLPGTWSNRLFLLLSELALEHHEGILKLIESRVHIGSAFALLRPMVECSLRAIWVKQCISEGDLKKRVDERRDFPQLNTLKRDVVTSLEGLGFRDAFALSPKLTKYLHGWTHGGWEALIYRVQDGGRLVGPSYPPELVGLLLQQATSYASIVAIARSQVYSGAWEPPTAETKLISERYVSLYPNEKRDS